MSVVVKRIAISIIALIIVLASFGGGIFVGKNLSIAPNNPAVQDIASKESFSSGGGQNRADFIIFWEAWKRLEQKFIDKDKIDPQKMIFGAVGGMVNSLGDPYTVFLPPKEAKRFTDDVKGEFGGIGAEIGIRKGIVTVVAPLKNSPAEKAGIMAGDKILKISGTSTIDLTLDEAVSLIRGEKGTEVILSIFREKTDESKEVKIIRDTIAIPVIDAKKIDEEVFYIHLFNFNDNSTVEFRKGLIEFDGSGAKKLILDLRNNPGGFLHAAVDIASWFLPAGETVVKEKRYDGTETVYRSVGHRFLEKTPIVVLVNQGSASASEILAGALRDKRGIKLVGEKTFGKGSVQELDELRDGASMKITIAKWLTPNDHSINDAGLEPDYKIELINDDKEEKDEQLERAVEIMRAVK